MNPARLCIEDTLRELIQEAYSARQTAVSSRGQPQEGFEIGRAEAFAEILHIWSNRLRTFGLQTQLDTIWPELMEYLKLEGYGPS